MTEYRTQSQEAPGSVYAPKYNPSTGGLTDAQTGEDVKYTDNPTNQNYTPPIAAQAAQQSATQPSAPLTSTAPTPIQPGLTPSPYSPTNTTPPGGMVPYDKALSNVPNTPDQAQIKSNLAKAYGMAHQQLQQSGQPAQDGNRSTIQNAVNQNSQDQQPQDPAVDNFYSTNPFIKQTNDQLMEWLNPKNTSDTLQTFVDAYASDRAELAGLKTELMNNKRIMGGTESDIRDEVTKAGGFATESQVQAMTLGRNKYLIANNAKLTDLISSQQDAVNTDVQMLGMAKDIANTQFNQRMSILSYQQENNKFMYNAAQDQFKTNLSLLGADGLYSSMKSNPQMISYYEKLNNLPSGALATAATQAAKDRANKATMDSLDIQAKKASIANSYSEINARNNSVNSNGTVNGKPQTIQQATANGYADRLVQSDQIISKIGSNFTSPLSIGGYLPNILQTGERQQYEQSQRNFINAVLRRESGAVISPSEFTEGKKQYFPQPGDKPAVVQQKADNRNTAMNNLYREANMNRPVYPGMIIESNGKKFQVDSDGVTLKQI